MNYDGGFKYWYAIVRDCEREEVIQAFKDRFRREPEEVLEPHVATFGLWLLGPITDKEYENLKTEV